jgi:hemimethylated DNA binding protein
MASAGRQCVVLGALKEDAVRKEGAAALIDALQGDWEDNAGSEISVNGMEVRFSDQADPERFEISPDEKGLKLRGARFAGTSELPRWHSPGDGAGRSWIRPIPALEPTAPEQKAWAKVFQEYKEAQAQLRRQRWAAAATDLDGEAALLQGRFAEGNASLGSLAAAPITSAGAEGGAPRPTMPLEQELRLHAGRQFVPGVCFQHRRDGTSGVIINCEPWCNAPAAWRSTAHTAELQRGERQPFYECLLDTDDSQGQTTLIAEEDLEPAPHAYPIKNPFAAVLLVQCDEIEGYLPSPRLEEARHRQKISGKFSLTPTWRHRRAFELSQRASRQERK